MWVEALPNGKFRAKERFNDPMSGRLRTVQVVIDKNTPSTRKKASVQLQEKIRQKCSFIPGESKMTIKEMCELYINEISHTLKQSSVLRNSYMCQSYIEIWGGDTLVNKLNHNYIRTRLLDSGMPAKSMNEVLKRFKGFLRWGYRHDYISDIGYLDKLERFKEDVTHKQSIKDKFLESSELKALLESFKHPVWKPTTAFLALTGLRYGEFCALLKSDVDLENRIISVHRNYDVNNKIVTSPKNESSIREIFIQDELIPVINELNEVMDRYRKSGARSDLFVFNPDGSFADYYAFRKYLKSNSKDVLDRDINLTPHVLRHTHASLLAERGIGIELISSRLGHSDSDVTKDIYIHFTNKRKEKEKEVLNRLKFL